MSDDLAFIDAPEPAEPRKAYTNTGCEITARHIGGIVWELTLPNGNPVTGVLLRLTATHMVFDVEGASVRLFPDRADCPDLPAPERSA